MRKICLLMGNYSMTCIKKKMTCQVLAYLTSRGLKIFINYIIKNNRQLCQGEIF